MNASASPRSPLTRNSSASIAVLVLEPERPGRIGSRAAAATSCCSCWASPCSFGLQLGELDPRRRQRVVQLAADLLGVVRDDADLLHVALVRALLARRPGSWRSRRRTGRRSGSRTRSGRRAAAAASCPTGGRRPGGRRRPAAAAARRPARRALLRRRLGRARRARSSSKKSKSRSVSCSVIGALCSGDSAHCSHILGAERNSVDRRETCQRGWREASDSRRLRPALVLGRYRPLRPLGSGGMGSVWHAYGREAGREVALKIVAARPAPPGRARSGRRPRPPSSSIRPACARTRSRATRGTSTSPTSTFPGRTLRHALERGELDDERAVEAAAQILEGARARARARDRPPRRQAGERPARRRRRASRSGCSTSAWRWSARRRR